MRGTILKKFLRAVDLLGNREGTTIDDLCEKLEIDRRSVHRLINVLHDLGFPIVTEKDPSGRKNKYKLMEEYLKKLPNINLPNINLTLSEIISLYFLKGEERLYKGTEIEKKINSAFAKISLFVPDDLSNQLEKIKSLFATSSKLSKDYSGKEDIIDSLRGAILQKKICSITYHSFYDDKIKNFKIDPLYFFENDGGLYVFVNKTDFNQIRTLAVERIQKMEITGSSFEYPKDFDPEKLLSSAFDIIYDDPIEAKIWFSADQARYVKERNWSKDQKVIDQDDGSIILEIKSSGWWHVRKWIMSFGSEAKVLEPEELRKEIIQEFNTAMDNYKK